MALEQPGSPSALRCRFCGIELEVPRTQRPSSRRAGYHCCRSCENVRQREWKKGYIARRTGVVNQSTNPNVPEHVPEVTAVPTITTNTVTKGSDRWRLAAQREQDILEAFRIAQNVEERRELETVHNQTRLDQREINDFTVYLKTVSTTEVLAWRIMQRIFYDNNIDTPARGFGLASMAFAARDHFGYKLSLLEMVHKVKHWIRSANRHGSRIHPTKIRERVFKYHITRDPKDFDSQVDNMDELQNHIEYGKEVRKLEKEDVLKESQTQTQEPEILVTTSGGSQQQ